MQVTNNIVNFKNIFFAMSGFSKFLNDFRWANVLEKIVWHCAGKSVNKVKVYLSVLS